MKSQAIIVLSVLGVFGTAGAAMAVNSGTLASVTQGVTGQGTEVLVPSNTPVPSTPSKLSDDTSTDANDDSTDAPVGVTPTPSHESEDSDSTETHTKAPEPSDDQSGDKGSRDGQSRSGSDD